MEVVVRFQQKKKDGGGGALFGVDEDPPATGVDADPPMITGIDEAIPAFRRTALDPPTT